MLHPGQRRGIVVELRARGGHVDVERLAAGAQPGRGLSQHVGRQKHHGRLELAVRPHASAQLGGKPGGELDAVPLHRDVDVDVGLVEQQVAHEPAHQVHPGEILRQRGAGPEQPPEEGVLRQRLHGVDLRRGRLGLLLLPPPLICGQHVGAGDDADDVGHRGRALPHGRVVGLVGHHRHAADVAVHHHAPQFVDGGRRAWRRRCCGS